MKAELTGFKTVTMTEVHLGVDQRVRVDPKLEVGAMTEAVEIVASAPLVQTSSSDLSTTVEEQQIKTLPLNGRNFVSLTRTVPGIARGIPGANIDGAGSLAWRASASFSANGQRPRDNNYMLDGVDNNETWLQTVVIFPSVDALDEFKVQTSTYSAEFGRSLGGVVNLQLKSGGNACTAAPSSSCATIGSTPTTSSTTAHSRRSRRSSSISSAARWAARCCAIATFFFADYQGMRLTQGQTYLSTVPSNRMRQGDFGELNRVIYDPLTNQPFANNVIPQARWDPAARNILEQLYPAPNAAGTRGATGQEINNYLINPTLEREDDQMDVKVDHNLTQANRFFVRYSYQKTHRLLPATLPHGDAGLHVRRRRRQHQGAGPGVQRHADVRLELAERVPLRLELDQVPDDADRLRHQPRAAGRHPRHQPQRRDLGDEPDRVPAGRHPQPGRERQSAAHHQPERLPDLRQRHLAEGPSHHEGRRQRHVPVARDPERRHDRRAVPVQLEPDVELRGHHQRVHAHCEHRVRRRELPARLGLQKNRNLFDSATYTEKRPEFALYMQDDFRATNKLTLNLGLRWDVFPPWIEIDDRQSNFDPSTGRFVVASPDAVINGVKVGRYLQTYSKRDFAPRLGFAYDVRGDARTIVRGGFGMFWNFTPGGTSSSKAQNPPFLQSTALTTTFGTNLRLSEGLPPPPGVDPNRAPAGSTRSIFDINFRDAYSQNWNFNVQQQFGTNYMVEIAYVGSRGRNMLLKDDPNQAPATVGVTDPNINRPYAQISPALRDLGRVASTGTLDYHGLLTKFQRRFADNFSVLTSYTWSKAIDLNSDNDGNVTLLNPYDPGHNRGPADYDVTHTFSSSVIYELPFGRDQWYGGWQTSGILYIRSGIPVTITQTQNLSSTSTINREPSEPDRQRRAGQSDDRPLVRRGRVRAAGRHDRHLRRRRPQHPARPGAVQHRLLDHQDDAHRRGEHGVPRRGVQPAEPSAVRAAERAAGERRLRHHHADAGQPGLLAVRHDGASDSAGGQGQLLETAKAGARPAEPGRAWITSMPVRISPDWLVVQGAPFAATKGPHSQTLSPRERA